MHPVTLEIILGGARPSAVDAFTAFYRLEQLRRVAQRQFEAIDALALPTAPTLYTVDQVLADPIGSIRGSAPTRTSSTCSTCVASQCRRHCILAPPAQRHSHHAIGARRQ